MGRTTRELRLQGEGVEKACFFYPTTMENKLPKEVDLAKNFNEPIFIITHNISQRRASEISGRRNG